MTAEQLKVSASTDISEATKVLRDLLPVVIGLLIVMAVTALLIEITLIIMYITLPIIRATKLLDRYIPDTIKQRVGDMGYDITYKKKSDNPTDRAEYLLEEMEKGEPSDNKVSELRDDFNSSKSSKNNLDILKSAADIEKYYMNKNK